MTILKSSEAVLYSYKVENKFYDRYPLKIIIFLISIYLYSLPNTDNKYDKIYCALLFSPITKA
jgi:hypothetical protein